LLEIYQIALLEWIADRLRWRNKPVPIVFATPDRAFSEMRILLNRSRGDTGIALTKDQNIPLPFLSLSEAGLEEYDGTRDNAGTIRGYCVDEGLTKGLNVDFPTPVNLPFNLEFWCESKNQLRNFMRQIRRLFKLEVTYVEIDFTSSRWEFEGEPVPPEVILLGNRQVALKKSTWTDASNLEPGESKREIRASLALVLTAWMARGFTEVPLAREIRTELVSLDDGELFATFVAVPADIVENSP
jgi:hypothetical protein